MTALSLNIDTVYEMKKGEVSSSVGSCAIMFQKEGGAMFRILVAEEIMIRTLITTS